MILLPNPLNRLPAPFGAYKFPEEMSLSTCFSSERSATIRKGTAFCVISDYRRKQVIEMLPDTKRATVEAALRRLPNLARCDIVTMDMCRRYRDAMHAVLPHAAVVIDKWHVQAMARRALLSVLDQIYKRAPKAKRGRSRKRGKPSRLHYRGLLIARRSKLEQTQEATLARLL